MNAPKYNPAIHHRRSIRLQGYDYAQAGLYFITICCQNRVCRFGEIENRVMEMNEYGKIAYEEWYKLSERFKNIELDVFQIMPNHMHGIIVINNIVGASLADAPTVGDIVGAYKSLVANACLNVYKLKNEMMGKLWQRNYWEHIIRNEKSYARIAEYILNNPKNWGNDSFYQ